MRLLWILVVALWAATALADEPACLRAAAARLERGGGGVTALADVLAAARTLGAVPPAQALRILTPAGKHWRRQRHRQPVVAEFLRSLLAEIAADAGDVAALRSWHEPEGLVTAWSWLGPFGKEHGSAFGRLSPVEREAPRLGATGPPQPAWPGRGEEVAWQPLAPGVMTPTGRLHVEEWLERADDAIVFLQVWLRPQRATTAELRLGALGPVRIWLDGAPVVELAEHPESFGLGADLPPMADVAVARVELSASWHRLLVKLGPAGGALPLRATWVAADGKPLRLEQASSAPPPGELSLSLPPTATLEQGLPPPPPWPEDSVLGLAWPAGAEPSPAVWRALFGLVWHGWPIARDLIERLLAAAPEDLPPAPDLALGHALLAGELGDRIDRLRQWALRLPDDTGLLLAQVAALDAMDKSAQAQRLWRDWSARTGRLPERESVRACVLRSELWTRLGGDWLASRLLADCARRWPEAPDVLQAQIREAMARDDLGAAAGLQQALAALLPGRLDRQTALLTALLDADQLDAAVAQEAQMRARFPGRSRGAEILARHALAAQQPAVARRLLATLPPHLWQASTWELRGRALAMAPEPAVEDAARALRRAVELAPARTDLRLRLARLQPDGEFFKPYQRDLVALVRREQALPRVHPAEDRLVQRVVQAVGNGQQAQYEALVRYIGPGGEPNHAVEVDYAPSLSRADVLQAVIVRSDGRLEPCSSQDVDQFGQDDSGMYFDLERITLRFMHLLPGDAIVVEHIERDLAPTPFGLVFGELMTLADVRPVRETDLAVLLPHGTPLRAEVVDPRPGRPPPARLQRRTLAAQAGQDKGAWDEWRLKLGPEEAIASEPNMPGATDVMPYVHLSTFADWPALATWWAQLAAEAMPAVGSDPVVRAEALRLTQGLRTDEEKVRAIHAFATNQVRYVGLEFGIHSLKPHPAREVLQRAFGDCKDKATLIVALLAEVGIPAQVALVRTANNGAIHDAVASLGVFNHAIAWVPGLGWWLDATATHHGPRELPDGDAGGVALRIAPEDASVRLERLPVAGAAENLQQLKVEAKLQATGGAQLDMQFELHGLAAAEARSQLWVATSRKEQMEQFLAARYPGIAVTEVTAAGIEPLADVLRVHVRARVPEWAHRAPQAALSVQPVRPSQPWVQMFGVQAGRKQPLVLAHTVALDNTVWLVPPPGLGVARVPAEVAQPLTGQDGKPLGRFALRASLAADGALVLRTQFELLERTVSVADLPRFLHWLAAVDSVLRVEVPLRPLAEVP